MLMKLWEHKKQGFSIIFFSYGHEKRSISNYWIWNLTSRLAYYGLFFHHILLKKKGKSQSPLFLIFFVNSSTELSTHIHHHNSKHPIKGDGSFFHLALGSWIWVHLRHHSTTNDPISILNANNNNKQQNVYYN